MNEPILRDLAVLSVTPEGDGSSLRITVGHHHSDGAVQEACVFRGLMAVQGYLRSTVAAAINRKHVPSLSFKYVGTIDEGTI
ncbi:MAG: hypothetical protein GY731_06340 [Gammaproteobacteria bacterium]|nr:hypothetical protein [Gammaproteobacteria bacterium]